MAPFRLTFVDVENPEAFKTKLESGLFFKRNGGRVVTTEPF